MRTRHAKLAAMAFKVHFSGQAQPQDFGDDDGFEFLEGGVLAIHFGDEEAGRVSPTGEMGPGRRGP